MKAVKIKPYSLPASTPDEIKDQLINDLFVYGRCVYKEFENGTIKRLNPLKKFPKNNA